MILTVTLNPSVDIRYKMDQFNLDTVNRVGDVLKTAGGKGINVARVLSQLQMDTAATGFLGGSLGAFIRQQMEEIAVQDHFVEIEGETRNCIAIIHEGKQSELLEAGPEIKTAEMASFLKKFNESIQSAQYVTISGSLPKGLPTDFYVELLKRAEQFDTPVLLDTSGKSLELALSGSYKPFLIKPNAEELSGLLGITIEAEAQIIEAFQHPLLANIPWVVVTLGTDGALVKHEGVVSRITIPKVEAVNPVGSGDSVVAGLAAGFTQDMQGEALLKYGLAMGVLNAMEEKTGSINPEKIEWCIEQMIVAEVKVVEGETL